jgi:Methyltransferase domain
MDYERVYQYRFREVNQGAREAVWPPIAQFVHDQLGRPRRVLDPAAGRCEFINAVPAADRWAVDRMDVAEGSERCGVRFVLGDVMEVELPKSHFDGVFVSNFLEHLHTPEAVAAFLGRMRAFMEHDGRIGVMGPNYRYCARQYWDCADHHVPLTHVSIEEHLYAAGFQPIRSIPRFLPYSFRSRLPASERLTATYLRWPPLWRVFGKQFLVIAER